jgi:cell division transport system permease protein
VFTLGQVTRRPLGSALTAAVIGVALALPAGLYTLVTNTRDLSRGWDAGAQISVFLRAEVDERRAGELEGELGRLPHVESVRLVSRAAALEEFRRLSGFAEVIGTLGQNPLPAVLLVRPMDPTGTRLDGLVERLRALPEVEVAQYDLKWVRRLDAFVQIFRRGVMVLGGLLALGVLLVVGNTVRLAIENRRQEIEVQKLCGATDGFIRRPFLYTGVWLGLAGAGLAWALLAGTFALIQGPVARLAELYHSQFMLRGLGTRDGLVLLLVGAALGWLGSWVAVGRHLGEIEPT